MASQIDFTLQAVKNGFLYNYRLLKALESILATSLILVRASFLYIANFVPTTIGLLK